MSLYFPKQDYSEHLKVCSGNNLERYGQFKGHKEVWLHFNRMPCLADVAPIRFGISMVSNPEIKNFMLSARSEHLFHMFHL